MLAGAWVLTFLHLVNFTMNSAAVHCLIHQLHGDNHGAEQSTVTQQLEITVHEAEKAQVIGR